MVQIVSRAPALAYTYTFVDSKTGALMFGAGDVAPTGSGTFSWASLDKALNWLETSSDTMYTVRSLLEALD